MTEDIKTMLQEAARAVSEEENSPVGKAIKKIISIEKNYYYSDRGNTGRLKEIREAISEFYLLERDEGAN